MKSYVGWWSLAWGLAIMATQSFNYATSLIAFGWIAVAGAIGFFLAGLRTSTNPSPSMLIGVMWAACFLCGTLLMVVDAGKTVEVQTSDVSTAMVQSWKLTLRWLVPAMGGAGGLITSLLLQRSPLRILLATTSTAAAFGIAAIVAYYGRYLLPHLFSSPFGGVAIVERMSLFFGAFVAGAIAGVLPGLVAYWCDAPDLHATSLTS